jgi:hypothetical protein
VVERLWRRVGPHIDLEDFVEAEPPPSGTRLREPGPADGPPDRPASLGRLLWVYRLGPLVAIFLGASAPKVAPSASQPQDEPTVVATAPAIVEGAMVPAPGPVPRTPPALAPVVEAPRAPASALGSVALGLPLRSRQHSETALLDRVRDALKTSDLPGALDALAEHARLFPGEESSARRVAFWSQVCASSCGTRARHEVAELEARCAPRP